MDHSHAPTSSARLNIYIDCTSLGLELGLRLELGLWLGLGLELGKRVWIGQMCNYIIIGVHTCHSLRVRIVGFRIRIRVRVGQKCN